MAESPGTISGFTHESLRYDLFLPVSFLYRSAARPATGSVRSGQDGALIICDSRVGCRQLPRGPEGGVYKHPTVADGVAGVKTCSAPQSGVVKRPRTGLLPRSK